MHYQTLYACHHHGSIKNASFRDLGIVIQAVSRGYLKNSQCVWVWLMLNSQCNQGVKHENLIGKNLDPSHG